MDDMLHLMLRQPYHMGGSLEYPEHPTQALTQDDMLGNHKDISYSLTRHIHIHTSSRFAYIINCLAIWCQARNINKYYNILGTGKEFDNYNLIWKQAAARLADIYNF
jgi:hypothetical protein